MNFILSVIVIILLFIVFKGKSKLLKLNEKFELQEMYFEELFKNFQEGIIILDDEYRIVNVNHSFERIFQYKGEEIKGAFWNDVIAEPHVKDTFKFSDIVMQGGTISSESKGKRRDGVLIDVNVAAFPFIINKSQIGLCIIYKDIAQEKKSQEELQLQKLYFSRFLKNSPEAICILDNEDRIIDVNSAFEKLFGYTKEELGNNYINNKIVHVEAIEEAENISKKVINGNVIEYETFRMKKDKSLFNVRILACPIFCENKQIGVFGIYKDITEQKRCEEELKDSEYTFRTLFESSSDAVIILENNKIIDCNTAAVELLKYDFRAKIIGKSFYELSPERQPDGSISKRKQEEILRGTIKNVRLKFEWWYERIDGTLVPVEVMMTTILLNRKKVFHCMCRDISTWKEMEQKLRYLSYRDQLTSLYNRRFFEEELNRMDAKYNFPLTIVMADVNGLKLINDCFGHTVGDELLKKVSEAIKKGCRNEDVIVRLGGDEFVILMPRTDLHKARQIINDIKDIALKEKVNSVHVDVSFGYECKINGEQKIEEIFKKAEDNMYKKKLFESPIMRKKTINLIINILYEKNEREKEHAYKVSELCKNMGEVLGLQKSQIEELKMLGLLHDIGKIAIEENILDKKGKLTESEWNKIKEHPEIGYRILSSVNDMSEISKYILAHHEKWDGSGYPKSLKQKEIPFQSRIIAIADAYDAMTSRRSYGSVLPEQLAIKELQKNAYIQFDPELIEVFIGKVLNGCFLLK